MKKSFLCLLCCLLSVAPATLLKAQDTTPAPEKDIVVIDLFSHNHIVPPPYAEFLRGIVLQGFADRGRHRIVDAEASRELSASLTRQIYSDPATATTMQAAWLEARMEKMAATGARYVVTGTLADYKFEHLDLPPSSSKAKPRPGFKATFRVVLSAYDLKFRRMMSDETYTLTATAPGAEDADRMALTSLHTKMEFYIDNRFKFETTCKIAKGDQQIVNAFEQGRGLSCVSDGQALF